MPPVGLGGVAVDPDVPALGPEIRPLALGPVREADDVEDADERGAQAVADLAEGDLQLVVQDGRPGRVAVAAGGGGAAATARTAGGAGVAAAPLPPLRKARVADGER